MNASTVFAHHLARLVSQLAHDPTDAGAHRSTVDALIASNTEAVTIGRDVRGLLANGEVISADTPGAFKVLARMTEHGLREMTFDASVEPSHLLGAVWILASEPAENNGATAVERLRRLGAERVEFRAIDDAPESCALHADRTSQLIDRLRAAATPSELSPVLDCIARAAEADAESDVRDVVRLLCEAVKEESRFADPNGRMAFTFLFHRLADSSILRALARGLPHAGQDQSAYVALLARFGDAAAGALLEELIYAERGRDRRVLYDAIIALRKGVRAIIDLLADDRWYVVRNAAEILGHVGGGEAEKPLSEALFHADARVRRSAAFALAKLGTLEATRALRRAMQDPSPDLRVNAIVALASRRDPATAPALIQALDAESDPEVQRAIFTALGRTGAPAAVRRLIETARNGGRIFRRTPTPVRVSAVRGLAEAGTPEAIATLESLLTDRNPEVSDSAANGLAACVAAVGALSPTDTVSGREPDWN